MRLLTELQFCPTSSKKEPRNLFLGSFFVLSLWRRTTCCLLRKQQKFAVVVISESAQTSSANGGSEPSNRLSFFC